MIPRCTGRVGVSLGATVQVGGALFRAEFMVSPAGQGVRPLPEGDRYLGFIFAEADTRHRVEQALTAARERLRVVIESGVCG